MGCPGEAEPPWAAAIDGSAKNNWQDGDGGTVIGTQTQEAPPKWVQLSAVESGQRDGPYLIVKQAARYRFDKDSADQSTSNCKDACAEMWPPVTIKDGGNIHRPGSTRSRSGRSAATTVTSS